MGPFLRPGDSAKSLSRRDRDAFRAAWYDCRRSVVHLKRNVDEFETYLLEEGFGRKEFRVGSVRLLFGEEHRQRGIRRLQSQVYTTAHVLGDNMDGLSAHLGNEDQDRVQAVLEQLASIEIPERYAEVLRAARTAVEAYNRLLEEIDERERFTDDPNGSDSG